MTASRIVQSVGQIFNGFWKRHRVNLGLLTASALSSKRLGVASLGRSLWTRVVPKHAIKRVDRFLGNSRFDHRRAQERLLQFVVAGRSEVLIAVDWTKIRSWPALVAGVIQRGRSTPVLWAVMDPRKSYKSQNAFENGFFSWLAETLPADVRATVLLDRGFRRVELVKHLRRCGLSFVIRTGVNVHLRHEDYHGRIDQLLSRRGQQCDLADAVLRPSRPICVRVVGIWRSGQKESWLLMTDRPEPVAFVAALYAKRFRIEETFRDQKDYRFGLFLGHVLLHDAERVERLLLIAALAHLVAMLVGGEARRLHLDRGYRANTVRSRPTHSDFTLGLFFVFRLRWKLSSLLRNFLAEPLL
jgi:hypothetical protein